MIRLKVGLMAGLVVVCALVALSASAELAILTSGDFLRVESHRLVNGDKIQLDLVDGGTLFLPVGRIERIVDDEIVRADERVELVRPTSGDDLFGQIIEWTGTDQRPESPYSAVFFAAGERFQLNPLLLAAMARAESAYDPSALSHKGARGLLQLMPATAERFGVRRNELYDPERNVEAASKYLKFLIDEFDGDLSLVLAAYNAGEGNVRKYGGVPPFRETQNYIRKIYRFLGLEMES